MANLILLKQPDEARLFNMDFSNKMTTNEVVTAVVSVISDPVGISFDTTVFSEQIVQVLMSGGTSPGRTDIEYNEYKITIKINTSNNQLLENDGFLQIKDK